MALHSFAPPTRPTRPAFAPPKPPRPTQRVGVASSTGAGRIILNLLVVAALVAAALLAEPVIGAAGDHLTGDVGSSTAGPTTPNTGTGPLPERPEPSYPSRSTPAGAGPSAGPRWDACTPVHWVLRAGSSSSRRLADRAISDLGHATGLTFRYDGETDSLEIPDESTPDHPVLVVAWANDDEVPEFAGVAVGVGGTKTLTIGTDARFSGGRAIVKTDAGLPEDFSDRSSVGGVLLHELGHAVGLGHSTNPDDIMYATIRPDHPAAYQRADLDRLARVADHSVC